MTDFFASGGAATDTEIPPELQGVDDEFVYDEPSSGGGFKPRVLPGAVTFRFEPTAYKRTNDQGGVIHEFTYTAHIQVADLGPGRLVQDKGQTELAVRFQRASHVKTAAMKEKHVSTDVERLYAGLGLLAEFGPPTSADQMAERIQAASGRLCKGDLIWQAAKKFDAGTVVFSTSPNLKKKNPEQPWPARVDGALPIEVTFPDGSTKFAQERIGRIYTPKAAKGA